jgi:hypothetical protein
LTEDNTITEVKAIALSYFLDVSEDWRLIVGDKWERKFLQEVEMSAEVFFPDLEVTKYIDFGSVFKNTLLDLTEVCPFY